MAVDALGLCQYQWAELGWHQEGLGQGRRTPDLGGGGLPGAGLCTVLSQGGPRLGLRVLRGGAGGHGKSSLADRGHADGANTNTHRQA